MSKLKELPISNCEKKFIKKALSEWNVSKFSYKFLYINILIGFIENISD